MHRDDFLALMEEIAPSSLADEEDRPRIGLVIEGTEEISEVCCALDATPGAAEEAVSLDASVLVVHHTPFWNPVHAIRGTDPALLRPLLCADINLFVMHTNFDRAPMGVNRTLASMLELRRVEEMRIGVIGDFSLSIGEIPRRLGEPVKVTGRLDGVQRLALVGGSGFDPALIDYAAKEGADAFLSSELKHHVAIASPIALLEASHHALEAPAMRRLAERLGWKYIETAPKTGYIG
ncbi:MAG: Nif3-like dinuclear metal center hexameric protein [Methanomicrobiales archaeon]|nr:Nif3-like dinuclear metal center hexameric protein [Methanomicrobiales archaeon]